MGKSPGCCRSHRGISVLPSRFLNLQHASLECSCDSTEFPGAEVEQTSAGTSLLCLHSFSRKESHVIKVNPKEVWKEILRQRAYITGALSAFNPPKGGRRLGLGEPGRSCLPLGLDPVGVKETSTKK